MDFIGTDSDKGMAQLKLVHAMSRRDIAESMIACIPGRLVGSVRASKVLFIVADRTLAILGGVGWSGYMKPEPHVLDVLFEAEDIQAVRVESGVPAHTSREVAAPVSRLKFVKSRVPSITVSSSSGKVLTFIPEWDHHLTHCAPVLADVLQDVGLYRAAAQHFFPDGIESAEAEILDCRLVDSERVLRLGKLVFGPRYIGFFELGHLTGGSTHFPAPRVVDLWSVQSCVLMTSRGNEYLERSVAGLKHIEVRHGLETPATLIMLHFPETSLILAPGIRSNRDEISVGEFAPFLEYCDFFLQPSA